MAPSVIKAVPTLLYLLSVMLCLLPLEKVGIAMLPFTPIFEIAPTLPPKGMGGYRRFHANDSLIGNTIPCTSDEKTCFRHNLIFNPKTDRCQPLGDNSYDCALKASRREFENGTGHIVGVCQKYDDPCWYSGYRMAYDGVCYDRNVVTDTICGCDLAPTLHFLGGVECRCTHSEPRNVSQPDEEGSCHLPDFRNPRPSHIDYFDQPLKSFGLFESVFSNCSTEQRRCFAKGKVWVPGANGCHSLLKRGPCEEDFLVVMDGRAKQNGRAETLCAHARGGCPRGQKRMAFDGQCHDDREIALIAPGMIVFNAFGVYEVLDYAENVEYRSGIDSYEDKCVVYFDHFWPLLGQVQRPDPPPCGPMDRSLCYLHDVVATPPEARTD